MKLILQWLYCVLDREIGVRFSTRTKDFPFFDSI
jgi:hypothetical protein